MRALPRRHPEERERGGRPRVLRRRRGGRRVAVERAAGDRHRDRAEPRVRVRRVSVARGRGRGGGEAQRKGDRGQEDPRQREADEAPGVHRERGPDEDARGGDSRIERRRLRRRRKVGDAEEQEPGVSEPDERVRLRGLLQRVVRGASDENFERVASLLRQAGHRSVGRSETPRPLDDGEVRLRREPPAVARRGRGRRGEAQSAVWKVRRRRDGLRVQAAAGGREREREEEFRVRALREQRIGARRGGGGGNGRTTRTRRRPRRSRSTVARSTSPWRSR